VAALDVLLWMCSIDCQMARIQFGALVSHVVRGDVPPWPHTRFGLRSGPQDAQRPPAEAVEEVDVALPELLLWCWLIHVAGNIGKSRSYARNPLWWVRNVDPVLRAAEG
jgi:hypothetical protein